MKSDKEIILEIQDYVLRTPKGHYYDKRVYKKLNEYNLEIADYNRLNKEYEKELENARILFFNLKIGDKRDETL